MHGVCASYVEINQLVVVLVVLFSIPSGAPGEWDVIHLTTPPPLQEGSKNNILQVRFFVCFVQQY